MPVGEGETLLYTGGGTTKRSVLTSWAGTGLLWVYIATVKTAEALDPAVTLLGPTATLLFASFGLITSLMAVGTTRCMVRYGVLTADGAHLRVYPYGTVVGIGAGTPVEVPLALLRENVRSKGDKAALYVNVKGSIASLVFDKPTHLPISDGPGSQLTFNGRGVVLQKGGLPKGWGPPAPGAAAPAPASVFGLSAGDKTDLRRYAVLVHALSDGVEALDAGAVAAGEWELDACVEQLRRPAAPRAKAIQDLALWRKAIDGSTGREYWWHEISWIASWAEPQVDGKGPYEHWPGRKALPVPNLLTPPAAAGGKKA